MTRSLAPPTESGHCDVILRFCNKSLKTLQVIWVDYEGRELHYATIEPGNSYGQGKLGCCK